MRTSKKLVRVCYEADANTYIKLLKRAEKSGVPVGDYIASRFVAFFGHGGVCNTRNESATSDAS